MNKIIPFLKIHPAIRYLVVFLLMIVPALLLFPTAGSESRPGMIILLSLVILANLIAVFPFKTK